MKKSGMASNKMKILRFLVSQFPEAESGPAVSINNPTAQEKEIATKIKGTYYSIWKKKNCVLHVDDVFCLNFLPSEEVNIDDMEVTFEELDASTGRKKSIRMLKTQEEQQGKCE